MTNIDVGNSVISTQNPTYFIADIAANHDGDVRRAKMLIELAKEAGADCAKFQHFRAHEIVSDSGFRKLGTQLSHQASWSKSVFQVYEEASIPWDWTPILAEHCRTVGIEFMSAPYDLEATIHLDPFVNAFKIGSGDITWLESIQAISELGKPVFLATGAASMDDVTTAVKVVLGSGTDLVLMQCNTNYTGNLENIAHANLQVLKTYQKAFPEIVLGLSDHTPGHVTVLGAVALGARVIEKHFTDDTTRRGPDHGFSMDPIAWREMVEAVHWLELALGDGVKRVEANELETVVVQRRCLRFARDLPSGHKILRDDLTVLRPAPSGTVDASHLDAVIGHRLRVAVVGGQEVSMDHLA